MSMTNCPKCGFFQPKDQYCADCGINMEKWSAPQKPLWKKVAGNWIFQISILFMIIFAVILKDNFAERDSKQYAEAPTLRRKSFKPPEKKESIKPNETDYMELTTASKPLKLGSQAFKDAPTQSFGSVQKAKEIQAAVGPLKKRISAQIYFVPKNNMASVLNSSTRLEDNVGTLHRKSFDNYRKKKKGWTTLETINRSFEFNEPKLLFVGDQFPDSDKNLGFYFQVTVFENSDAQTINYEIKLWNELKINSEGSDALTFEITMKRKHALVLTQFAPKGITFNEEEATFFESHQLLRTLNSSRFIEDFGDLLLVLEIQ